MGEFIALHERRKPSGHSETISAFVRVPGIKGVSCNLLTVSRDGACVHTTYPLADFFILRVAASRIERMCQVLWRKDNMVGAQFVTAKTMGRSPTERKTAS